jgi:hypothetical protein
MSVAVSIGHPDVTINISEGRVSQLRRELATAWNAFVGEGGELATDA